VARRPGSARGSVTRCAVCDRRCIREVEPARGATPAVLKPDVWRVVFRTRRIFDGCLGCWMKSPDEWKDFPADQSHGHVDPVPRARDFVTLTDLLELVGPPRTPRSSR
jgi:hypothetical protein